MYQQERMDEIMRILKKYNYVTVDYLVKKICYSPASIRRDLTLLEKQGLVTRSYGGVSVKEDRGTPFRFRQHSMRVAKNGIAKRAAALVKNGDTVFLDGSSTTQYMGRFLTEKKGITVITCNMTVAAFLAEHGVTTYCTGGRVVDNPGILGGEFISHMLSQFCADIAFFSTSGIDTDGRILSAGEGGVRHVRTIRENARKLVFLCGSDKMNQKSPFCSMSLDDVDYFVSDGNFDKNLKEKYKNTVFITTKE